MKKVVLLFGLILMTVSVSAQTYFEELERAKKEQKAYQEFERQRSSSASPRVYNHTQINNNNSYGTQQQARRVRGTVFNGNNQIQVFLYVIDKGNSMYVTSYTTGEKDMYGQEFTNSVQQNAQRTSFQYDGDLSQYYEWKVSLRVGNGYVTCYF